MTGEHRSASRRRERPGGEERGAVALTGGGPSILGVNGSMRARDVSRPRPVDVAEAERLVQVSYRPRSKPPGAVGPGQPDGSGGSSPLPS